MYLQRLSGFGFVAFGKARLRQLTRLHCLSLFFGVPIKPSQHIKRPGSTK